MVIRKRLLATVGWRSTSKADLLAASRRSGRAARRVRATRCTSRCIFGGLPSSTSIGMSMARSPPGPSSSTSSRLVGGHADHRERAALALAHRPRTAAAPRARPPARSAPGSRCTRFPSAPGRSLPAAPCAGRSARRGRRRRPARGRRWRCRRRRRRGSRGSGCASPSAQQWLMTSCARRWISGLPRCTESKSSAAVLAAGGHRAGGAAAHADAHARAAELDQQRAGGERRASCVCAAAIVPRPPAIMIGL